VRELAFGGQAGVCVAVPACNEADHIGSCLEALSRQSFAHPFSILVDANNCTDATAAVVRRIAAKTPLDIHLLETRNAAIRAPAAVARRRSVNAAMEIAGRSGVVLMSDADSIVAPDWIETNVRSIRQGMDVICGTISPVFAEVVALPHFVLERGAREFAIEQAHIEIECLLDGRPWDPWPRHRTESAASLACRVEALVRVGGVPIVEPGEDRELVKLIRRSGGRIRHLLQAQVTTSCRLDGRARGGWADDLRERINSPDGPCHANLEPTADFVKRVLLRSALRAAWPVIDMARWCKRLELGASEIAACLDADGFEDAWARIEACSPRLTRRRISAQDVTLEIERAASALLRIQLRSSAAGAAPLAAMSTGD
jgi:GT2 family glycosyltransferase